MGETTKNVLSGVRWWQLSIPVLMVKLVSGVSIVTQKGQPMFRTRGQIRARVMYARIPGHVGESSSE